MAHAHQHHEGHHEAKGLALAHAAQATLERAGEQWTAMRAAVFDALAGFDRPASAYDVTEAISRTENRRVAANSVYRILDLFVGTNLVRRVESRNGYVVNVHPDCPHDCIFLVCDGCGATTHVDDDTVTRQVRAAAERAGYVPERPVLEVRGRCPACAAAGI
jgi:Fur family zinc uptake transcriptional regulator